MRNDNPRTGFCEEPGRGRSDSSAAARNECDFSVEIAHLVTFEFDAAFRNLVNLRRVASGTLRVVIKAPKRSDQDTTAGRFRVSSAGFRHACCEAFRGR